MHCDHEGNLWIGTRTGGLDQLRQRRLVVISSGQGLTNDYTHGIAQTPDGTIWVGTVGGALYHGGPAGFEPFRPPQEQRVYYYATVFPLLTVPDGSLWWGAAFGLLHWKDNRLADCITNEPWIQNATVTALQNDGQDGFWIGTSAGHLLHFQKGRFTEFPKLITRAAITSLAVQRDGTLWVGTVASGLKRVREADRDVFTVTNGLSAKSSIRTLYLDGDGTLWIGTTGGGLFCRRGGKLTGFSASQGLVPRTVSQIVEDDHGFLWLGCSRGIFRVSKRDLIECADGKLLFIHARSFGINDGMLAEECSGGFCPAGLKTKSGLICISTVKGLVFINPDEPSNDSPPPRPLFEEMLVNGQPRMLETNSAWTSESDKSTVPRLRLVIPPGGHDVQLHYTAVQFSAPEKVGFRFKMDGLDSEWTPAGDRRTAYYPLIGPGDYVFRLNACNADGAWNKQDTLLAVTVLPFFWETAWFRTTVSIILLGLFAGTLWWLLRQRYRRRLAWLQTLNAIDRERLRISRDMHDHVGGMLTQVSQLSDMGLGETADKALVQHRLERIGNRARLAVQSLDEIVWATNPKNDNLASFAEYISRFSDEFFEYTKIRCWQEVPASLPALPLRADVRHNVFLAVREALNNALKHSHGTEVWLRISFANHHAVVEVEDNGCGFTVGQTPTGGNGLENMQARLAEDGGQTEIASTTGKGTRIRFTFSITP